MSQRVAARVKARALKELVQAVKGWLEVYDDGNRMDTSDGAVVRCALGMKARAYFRATEPRRRRSRREGK